jgi:hypothetical protein
MDSLYKTAVDSAREIVAKVETGARVAYFESLAWEGEAFMHGEWVPLPPVSLDGWDKEYALSCESLKDYRRKALDLAGIVVKPLVRGGTWATYSATRKREEEPASGDVDLHPRGTIRVRMNTMDRYVKRMPEKLPLRCKDRWRVTWENPLSSPVMLGGLTLPECDNIPSGENFLHDHFPEIVVGGRLVVWSLWSLAELPLGASERQADAWVMYPDGGIVVPRKRNRTGDDTPQMGQFERPRIPRDRKKMEKRMATLAAQRRKLVEEILAEEPALRGDMKALRRRYERLQKQRKHLDVETGSMVQSM